MTETPPAERYAWRTSTENRGKERTSDLMARTRAEQRNTGWVRFAVAMLLMTGVLQIVTGLSAFLRRETFLVPQNRLVLDADQA